MGILVSFHILASYLILYFSLAFVLKNNFVICINNEYSKVNRSELHGLKNKIFHVDRKLDCEHWRNEQIRQNMYLYY